MDPIELDRWIPTERTHSLYYLQVFGSWPAILATLAYLWFTVLVPQDGLTIAAVIIVVAVGACAAGDLFAWVAFRTSAIRASESGIGIRRATGSVLNIPADKLALRPRKPGGFGFVSYPGGKGFILSPNQFTEAKRFFAVAEPVSQPAATPLP